MTKLLGVEGGAGSCASACWTSVTRTRYDSLTAICKVNVPEKQHLSNPVPHLPFSFLWLNSFISPLDTTSPSITLSNVTRIKLSKRPEIDQYATPVLSSSAPGVERRRNGGRCVCLAASLFSFVIRAAVKRVSELKDPSIMTGAGPGLCQIY